MPEDGWLIKTYSSVLKHVQGSEACAWTAVHAKDVKFCVVRQTNLLMRRDPVTQCNVTTMDVDSYSTLKQGLYYWFW